MKRRALVSLSAALPIATLAVGSSLAQAPKAVASEIASPAAAVQAGAKSARPIGVTCIIVLGRQDGSGGIGATTKTQAATSLDG